MDEITVSLSRPRQLNGVGPLITMGRELRGLGQGALAAAIGIPHTRLHRYEAGLATPKDHEIEAISAHLGLPLSYFSQSVPAITEPCWRRQQSMTVRDRKCILASAYRIRATIERFLTSVDIQPALPFRAFHPEDYDGNDADIGEQIASEVRVLWGIPPGPIRNLMQYVEAAGVLVQAVPFLNDQVDALTWTTLEPRIVLMADGRPGCRRRMSLAHEMAHHFMGHLSENKCSDEQAKTFASALLLPVDDFVQTWPALLTIDTLGQLKQYWGVSIQGLLYRARKLNVLDERVYQNWMVMFTRNGWRKNEPVQIPVEKPVLVRDMIATVSGQMGLTLDELAEAYGWFPAEFGDIVCGPSIKPFVMRTTRPPLEPTTVPLPDQGDKDNVIRMPERFQPV